MKKKHSEIAKDKFFGKKIGEPKKPSKQPDYRRFIQLKVSEGEKYANDGQYFKDILESVSPSLDPYLPDFAKMKAAYEIINNDLSSFKSKVDLFCDPLGELLATVGEIEEELQAYPVIRNKINVLLGEHVKRNEKHRIVLLSLKAIKEKDKQLLEALTAAVEEELAAEIQAMQDRLEGKSEEEVQAFIEQVREEKGIEKVLGHDFKSDYEIFYNDALKYSERIEAIPTKKLETFKDLLISDRFCIYSGWRFGKPHLEVRNPLYLSYKKDPNERLIHKSDYIIYRKPVTLNYIIDNYPQLSEDDIDSLLSYSYSPSSRDKRNSVLTGDAVPIHEGPDLKEGKRMYNSTDGNFYYIDSTSSNKNIGLNQTDGNLRDYSAGNRLVWETHLEFKSYRQVVFLSYTDDYNERITLLLPNDFEIPKHAVKEKFINKYMVSSERFHWNNGITDYTAEVMWIPRKYEVIRLGTDVYPVYGEVPYQSTNLDNPFSNFNLSTFGLIMNARNAKSLSLVEGAIPAYFQYLYVKHVQNRELAKYEGFIQNVDVDQIPKELGIDVDGQLIRDPIATWLAIRKKTSINIYSGSQTTGNRPVPSTRSPGSTATVIGTAADIFNLQQLADLLEKEIGWSMGISPQREAQFSSNTNVTDNQQAIVQSANITEPYYFFHAKVWDDVLNDYLKNFRTWQQRYFEEFPEETHNILHYIGPDGKDKLFRITPKMLEHIDFGLYSEISQGDQKYMEYMLQNIQPLAQNAGEGVEIISGILKDIFSGASPEEVHKQIQIIAEKQRIATQKAQEAQEKAREAFEQKMQEKEIEHREDVQEHEKEKIILKETISGQNAKDIQILKNQVEILSNALNQ
jgi:hypothetical protein